MCGGREGGREEKMIRSGNGVVSAEIPKKRMTFIMDGLQADDG